MTTPPKLCQKCSASPAKPTERYCTECRKTILRELREAGYLGHRPVGHVGDHRTTEQREDIWETKHGG